MNLHSKREKCKYKNKNFSSVNFCSNHLFTHFRNKMTEMFRWEKFPDNPSTLKEYTADLWRDYVILYGPKHEETPLFEIYLPTSTPTNLVVREIEQKGNKPISRNGLVTAVYKDSFYVHGGFSISNFLGDFHVFDLITHTWRQIEEKKNQPSPRNYHSAALYKNKWIIFGTLIFL